MPPESGLRIAPDWSKIDEMTVIPQFLNIASTVAVKLSRPIIPPRLGLILANFDSRKYLYSFCRVFSRFLFYTRSITVIF